MMHKDMLQEFTDFRKKLKTEVSANDFLKSPKDQQKKNTFKDKLKLSTNLVSTFHKQVQPTIPKTSTAIKCITHSGLDKYDQIRYASQQDLICVTPKNNHKKQQNITDKLLGYTQLQKLTNNLSELTKDDLKELPNEYLEQLIQLSKVIQTLK